MEELDWDPDTFCHMMKDEMDEMEQKEGKLKMADVNEMITKILDLIHQLGLKIISLDYQNKVLDRQIARLCGVKEMATEFAEAIKEEGNSELDDDVMFL